MTHICNYCEYQDICKDKFKDRGGMLCSNKYFQNKRETEWRQEREQENNSI